MITLNDYLYSGDTLFRILRKYTNDLREDAKKIIMKLILCTAIF